MKYYKQTDSRWSKRKYAGSTMGRAGCGATCVAMVVEKSPKSVGDWMEKNHCTVPGCGTTWAGIQYALTHYGFKCDMLNTSNYYGSKAETTAELFRDKLYNGNCYGILLMGKSMFTSGGHYICILKADKKKGLYVYDPYSRNLCGWHKWKDFEGKVKIFYSIKKKSKVVKKTTKKAGVKYYRKPKNQNINLVDSLDSINVRSDYKYRQAIAKANGYSNYNGSASQNLEMLLLLRAGKLRAV